MRARGVVFLLGIVFSAGAYAQPVIGSGTVTGKVSDYTGSGIPDTTVILSNPKLGIVRNIETSDDGTFYDSAMVAGTGYSMKVTRKGFGDLAYNDFEILAGHTLYFNITMAQEPASNRREAEKASIEMQDATYGWQGTQSEPEVEALPTRNRDVNTLVPLAIGVVPSYVTGQLAFHSELSTNAFLMDGILVQNIYFYDKAPIGPMVSQEAVREVQAVSAGAPGEFQHTLGGTVNVVTRGGGEGLHGEVYDYFNTHSFNAADRYAPGFVPPGWQHQFGGNAGGRIFSKNWFWFVNLEDLDGHYKELNHTTNPLLVNPAGTAILPSNCTATAAQCNTAINFLNLQLNRIVDTALTSPTAFTKFDWRPNDFNQLSFEGGAMHRHSLNGTDTETVTSNAGVLGYNGTYTDESRFAKVGYTAVWSANAVNELRAGWYRDRFSDYEDTGLLPSTGALGISIAGTPFGGNPEFPRALSEQRYQIVENFTAALGPHLVKLVADYSLNEDWNRQIINSAGSYYFPSLTSFAEDFSANTTGRKDYTNFSQAFGQPIVDLHTKRLGVSAQDTWKPFSRLTVVLGILWEKTFIPQPTDSNVTYFQTATIHSPSLDFSPRIGLAYELDSRTVVRASAGTFYQPLPGQLLQALFTGNGVYQLPITVNPTQTGAPVYPKIIVAPNSVPAGMLDLGYGVNKLHDPLLLQGTFSIERKLSNSLTLSLNYLYNRGTDIWVAVDQNLNTATVTKEYPIDNAAGSVIGTDGVLISATKSNTNFAHVYQIENEGASWYNGAALQLRKRMSHGLAVQASYTWSHALDDVSGPPAFAGFVPTTSISNSFRTDRGNSSFDQPNRVLVNWTWQPTPLSSGSWAARYLINGWQLSGIATLAASLRETPIVVVNSLGVTTAYPTSVDGSGGWSRVPFEPVNSLLTGPQYTVDARLTRELPFTERIKGQLMVEAFNAFNTQFNTSVNTIAYQITGGVFHPVPGAGVGNGAAGYPWGDNARHLQVALRIVF